MQLLNSEHKKTTNRTTMSPTKDIGRTDHLKQTAEETVRSFPTYLQRRFKPFLVVLLCLCGCGFMGGVCLVLFFYSSSLILLVHREDVLCSCGIFRVTSLISLHLCNGSSVLTQRMLMLKGMVETNLTWGRTGVSVVCSLFPKAIFLTFIHITKTFLYIFDPLKPHFYTVKLEFTGVYIIFLFLLKNIDCGYSLELPRRGGSYEYPQSMFCEAVLTSTHNLCFWAEIWKISEFSSENFQFLVMKFSIGVFS